MKLPALNHPVTLTIPRPTGEILRGFSILCIMLHNLFHLSPKMIQECEFSYSPSLTDSFLSVLRDGGPHLFYNLFSFLGWYGVPVFVFLSGYGLVQRYELSGRATIFRRKPLSGQAPGFGETSLGFLVANWSKLFRLMILAVAFLVAEYIFYRTFYSPAPVRKRYLLGILLPLTSLNDLVQFWYSTYPGVYWYFGLAFELYVIYALLVNGRPAWWLWTLALVCTVAYFYFRECPPMGNPLKFEIYYRHNFTGWLLPFAAGVWLARHPRLPLWSVVTAVVLGVLLFIPLLSNLYTWQLSPLAAIVIILVLGIVSARVPLWRGLWVWVGQLSAFLFVVHPIVRQLFIHYVDPLREPRLAITLLDIALTFLGAILYRALLRLIPPHWPARLFGKTSSPGTERP